MIDVYTVNHWHGDVIRKRKALKMTTKTVTFEDGKRENLCSGCNQHFRTLEAAVQVFELECKHRVRFHEQKIEQFKQMKAFVDAFVAKERGEA